MVRDNTVQHVVNRATSLQQGQQQVGQQKSQQLWQGRIVSRNLEPGRQAQCEGNKPLKSAITNISHLQPALTDPVDYRPDRPSLASNPFPNLEVPIETSGMDLTRSTTLEIFLYSEFVPKELKKDLGNGPLRFQMNRESSETVARTLHRLEISLLKRLKVGHANSKSNRGLWYRQSQDSSAEDNVVIPHSVWKLTDAKEGLETMVEWDCLQLTNLEVWNEAASTPLIVRLEISEFDARWDFVVEANPPTICGVQTFEDFSSHIFVDVPLVVRVNSCFADHVCIDWFVDGQQMKKDCPMFCPSHENIGKEVAVLLTPTSAYHDGRGQQEGYKFERIVEALPENDIVALRRPAWTSPRAVDQEQLIRAVTWNVLADQNTFEGPDRLNAGFASYLEPDVLCKKRRMPLVVHEILSYDSDLICLQEVDECVFRSLLQPVLEYFNYRGYHSRKSSQGNREGCAMFWKRSIFETSSEEDQASYAIGDLVSEELLAQEMLEATLPESDRSEQTCRLLSQLFRRRPELAELIESQLGHVVQVCTLNLICHDGAQASSPKSGVDRLVVANTHLFYHEHGSHIRMIQMFGICKALEHIWSRSGKDSTALILCGDFNTSLQRGAGQLLLERHVAENAGSLRPDLNGFRYDEESFGVHMTQEEKKESINQEDSKYDGSYHHDDDFPAMSVPSDFPELEPAPLDPPEFTNFVVGSCHGKHIDFIFSEDLDHILVSRDLRCVRSAPMPSIDDVSKNIAMPSPSLPSDHVSIVVDLELTAGEKKLKK